MIEQLSELISMSDSDGVVAVLNGLIQRADQNEMLRNLNVPQLFIFGREDEFIPVAAAEAIGRRTAPGRNRMARPFGPYGICRGAGTGVGNPDRVYRPVPVKQCCGWFAAGWMLEYPAFWSYTLC